MPTGKKREKVLYGILAKRPRIHRYTVARWVVGVLFTVLVAALPLADILRFDFWRGRHVVLGETVGIVAAAKAFAFPFLAINILIIVATRFYGRYLCGFVCPVGSLARIAEWGRYKNRKGRIQIFGPLVVFAACLLLGIITFAFWIDWHVFIEGSPFAFWVSSSILAAIVIGLFVTVQWVGLRFCLNWCPSGVYFALLGPRTVNGVEFAHPENCTECKACEKSCPMDLHPTEMSGGEHRDARGLYGDAMSNFALCIRCGDCITACEGVIGAGSDSLPLRMGVLPQGARESRDVSSREPSELPPEGKVPGWKRTA